MWEHAQPGVLTALPAGMVRSVKHPRQLKVQSIAAGHQRNLRPDDRLAAYRAQRAAGPTEVDDMEVRAMAARVLNMSERTVITVEDIDSDSDTDDDTQGNAGKGDDVRPAEALLPGTVEVDCKRMTVQELFEHFGQAGEHGLGETQILAALSANGVQESEAFMHDILNTFDLDGNGRLDLEEFTQMHAIVSMRARLSKARKAARIVHQGV